jgi:SHS2 domain-containing protein
MRNYELIEHTADIGIRVKAANLEELFKFAALAMFDIIAEKQKESVRPRQIIIRQKADNLEELFINWLNEILSLYATKELVFCDFKFYKLDETSLEAAAKGCPIKNYKINTEIKAATYHQLEIKQVDSQWQAEVIFDV